MNTNFRKKTAGHIILPLLSTVIGSQVPSLNLTHKTTYPKLYFPLHLIHVAITHRQTFPSLNQTHNTTYPKLYFPLHFIHVAITHWHT